MAKKHAAEEPAAPAPQPELTIEAARRLAARLEPVDSTFVAMAPNSDVEDLLLGGMGYLNLLLDRIAEMEKTIALTAEQRDQIQKQFHETVAALHRYANDSGGGQIMLQNFELCLNMVRDGR